MKDPMWQVIETFNQNPPQAAVIDGCRFVWREGALIWSDGDKGPGRPCKNSDDWIEFLPCTT